jgi:cytoplasmic iron level regulating protein YaaA (DUF328/UPF0246 family)
LEPHHVAVPLIGDLNSNFYHKTVSESNVQLPVIENQFQEANTGTGSAKAVFTRAHFKRIKKQSMIFCNN